mgnify:CR=1 FL=1
MASVPGFTGLNCTLRACAHDCGPHGMCRDGGCACDSGFSGERCEQKVCPTGGVALGAALTSSEVVAICMSPFCVQSEYL